MAKKLVPVNEVMEIIPMSSTKIYELARQNIIPHVRIGRKVLFDLEKIEAWIDHGGTSYEGGWRKVAGK